MSNTAVTPLFPVGRRVQAWCVTQLRYKQQPTDPNPTTQTMFDAVNFIDGYNLRLDFQSVTTPSVFIPFKFSFLNPLSSKNYRVFAHVLHKTDTYPIGSSGNESIFPYRSPMVYDVPRFPKTKQGFWMGFTFLSSTSTDSYIQIIYPNAGIPENYWSPVSVAVVVI